MNAPLKILLVGDVMLGRQVNERLRQESPEYPWGDTLPLFLEADWRACNLECVLSDHGVPWGRSPKAYHLRTDAINLAALRAAHIDAVSLANNHSLDFNYRGMVEMLKLLGNGAIASSGLGGHLEAASQCAVSLVKGLRIGFLAFTDNEPTWEAGDEHPGGFYVPVDKPDHRTARLLKQVAQAKAQVDFLIVSAHWGGNWGCFPPPSHTRLAHDLARAGASVIFGHSPHVSRGIEVFDGALILYSTGDFIDDYAVDPIEHNDRSWAFELRLEHNRIRSLHLHPIEIAACQARRAEHAVSLNMIESMQELCRPFGTISTPSTNPPGLVIDIPQNSNNHRRSHEPVAPPIPIPLPL